MQFLGGLSIFGDYLLDAILENPSKLQFSERIRIEHFEQKSALASASIDCSLFVLLPRQRLQ